MSAVPVEPPPAAGGARAPGRRRMTSKQGAVLDRLVDAAAALARESGYEGVSVRAAAARAGVAPATAYGLVASKDHLLAEVMWRAMADLPASGAAPDAAPADRVTAELGVLGTLMAGEPVLAAAGTTALLGPGPDVRDVRLRMGQAFHARLASALGDAADPVVLRTLDLFYTGTLLSMGMGHLPGEQVPEVLVEGAALIMGGRR